MAAAVCIREPHAAYEQRGTSDERPATNDRPLTRDPRSPTLSEAELSRLWAGQRFPASALATRGGAPVRVLHPGRAGRGAGPDFRDAIVVMTSGAVLRGDVELHVRASDFHTHGHGRDPAYNRVVLHVVFEDDGQEDTRLANGRCAPVVALAPWLRRRAGELAGWLSSPRLWREPCHDALARLSREDVLRVLGALGDERFAERCAALAASVREAGAPQALYRALLDALGYGGDRLLAERIGGGLPLRRLAQLCDALPANERRSAAEAALLAVAGIDRAAPWRGRPANHPARRLPGLARLIVRHRALFEDPTVLDCEAPVRDLIASWSAPPEIGRSRALELLVNAVLPWAAACAEAPGDAARADALRVCFARLPRPGRYGALAFLEHNLRDGERPLPLGARAQQGLLALYKTQCTRGGCGRCQLS